MSADLLAVHAGGEADLNVYAYVSATVLRAVDPVGLQSHECTGSTCASQSGPGVVTEIKMDPITGSAPDDGDALRF